MNRKLTYEEKIRAIEKYGLIIILVSLAAGLKLRITLFVFIFSIGSFVLGMFIYIVLPVLLKKPLT